ncbi:MULTISPECIES: methyl-accepting chemotaxis protein [Lysinibacillus]|jgi:methyl-accepting chemotaxis protein|uniref:Methyl-accepting chemotaxis protein n=1 Tax=Lysinibacillus fusiformis TaxID=28031 RepID=A0A2I0UX11_9BACI|nr:MULTISPECIES: methyl-accepting chemotaxis protein [Lysinibacillus]KUF35221.1 chemotaxis protein [Lysinibacillus sp. F5]PKU50529.1 methyl-accepting chemotaxis protein [Lysinibacillus fusiformis]WCH47510.1 methyl-accepting chemotaxis protein [Lysinibacillus sp. OF-1]SCY85524.1 methyl-accepting chemotaxis protein [Lysinibacillus sp. SG9]SDB37296.1 methyl-accepting chemotaxis protein [Lysinibacillus sp. TC-37]
MRFTIYKKLLLGFFIVILVLVTTIGLNIKQLDSVNKTYRTLLEEQTTKSISIQELRVIAKQEIVSMRGYLLLGDKQNYQSNQDSREEFKQKSEELMATLDSDESIKFLEAINKSEQSVQQFADRMFALKAEGETEKYEKLDSTQGRLIIKQFDERVENLSNYQSDYIDKKMAATSKQIQDIKLQMLLLGVFAVVISLIIAMVVGSLMSRPINGMAKAAKKIAEGDLTAEQIRIKNRDEVGDLALAFNQMAANLKDLITNVRQNTVQVSGSAAELTASADQTIQATEQITSSIQEVASGSEAQGKNASESSEAMKNMTKGIQQLASTTAAVSELAIETNSEAKKGNDSLHRVISQMTTINTAVLESASVVKNLDEHSIEIGNIIGIITDIAEQTNLLALNAAIEAARAGDHGRGFAVVADEVKKLAEQSKKSAEQIATLISEIQQDTNRAVTVMDTGTQEVQIGMKVVKVAEEGFSKIVELIEQVSMQIQEATTVSEEMSSSAEQIYASFDEIATIAQMSSSNLQNVASASEEQLATIEEVAASAATLSNMAEELHTQVSRFKLD